MDSALTPFQALVTGSIAGALAKAARDEGFLSIDVRFGDDGEGNYTNEVHVTGKESGEQLVVRVERAEAIEGPYPDSPA